MSDFRSRRHFLKQLAAAGAALGGASVLPDASFSSGRAGQQRRPNFVLFLTDDHGRRDTGCYGNEVVRTPNIDRLSEEGMRFRQAFAITATCTPARSSLYTGLGPHRHGGNENHSSVDENVQTLPEYLRELGYRVLLAGKTHIQPKDEFPFEYIDTEGDWTATIVSEESEVADFLRRDATDSQPFCLVIATNDPHVPWPYEHDYDPADMPLHPYLLDTAETRQAMANYYADVERMDEEVGRTLDLLDEGGLADDTVFVYTSDQGPQLPHAKWELYDYGINVPFLVRWPGRVEAGSTSDAMISSVDVLPTLVEMAGGTAPSGIDGWSFRAVLEQEQAHHRDEVFATHTRDGMMNYYPMRAIRTERYKYIWNLSPERAFTNHITNSNNFRENGGAGLFNSWLARANQDTDARDRARHYQHRPPEELYDLRKDPHELNDVAAETAYQDVKADLRERLTRWMEQQGDEGRQSWSTRFDEE